MKWIKASDALPLPDQRVIVRWYKHGEFLRIDVSSGHQLKYWLETTNEVYEWLDESPPPVEQEIARDPNTKYTYYRMDFENWGGDYDYTIVETLEAMLQYLEAADIDLDDPEQKTKITVTGVAMTPVEYGKWIATLPK